MFSNLGILNMNPNPMESDPFFRNQKSEICRILKNLILSDSSTEE